MITVALIGPDGSGKTTVARELQRKLDLPSVYLYMGVNFESSNRVLPLSRLIRWARRKRTKNSATTSHATPQRSMGSDARSRRGPKAALRSAFRLGNRLAEETYRQILTSRYLRSGQIVIFDRHFFADYYASDVCGGRRERWSDRLHGLFLKRIYPKPDLVVYLDAPAEVLFARKGEGTLESLAQQKRNYERLEAVAPLWVRVDANRPLDAVVADIAKVVCNVAEGKRGANIHGRLSLAEPTDMRRLNS